MINNEQPEPPVDFAGAARIFFRQTQKLIDTVADLERKEIQQIIERHRNEHKWRAGQMAGAAKDLELVKAECCEVILEDVRTKGSWANLPATPTISPATATTQSSEVARAAEEIREWIGISGLVDGEGINEVAAIISKHLGSAAVSEPDPWQSMDSAPKGVDVLLVWEDRHQQIEFLTDKPSFWFENAPIAWRHLPAGPSSAPATPPVTEDSK